VTSAVSCSVQNSLRWISLTFQKGEELSDLPVPSETAYAGFPLRSQHKRVESLDIPRAGIKHDCE
jgi:hypothetical protein